MEPRNIPVHDYPYVSPCGKKELNFIRPAASPIVFHSSLAPLLAVTDNQPRESFELVYGGNLRLPFDWHALAVSPISGRLYHRAALNNISYGLIRSQVAVSLVERMELKTAGAEDEDDEEVLGFCKEGDSWTPLALLPSEAEPGPWAMPWDYE